MEYSKFNPGLSPRAVICSWRPNLPHQSEIVLVLHYWFNPFPKVRKAPEYIKRFSVSISNAAFAIAKACKLNDIYTVQCREYLYVFCRDTDTAVSLLCLFIYLCANSHIHTIYACVYIYLYKKVCIYTQSPTPYLSQTLSFISNINVQRVAEQVELLSASQGSVVSNCNVIPRQKKYILVL